MTPATVTLPLLASQGGIHRFTVAEYERLTEMGILTEDDNLELLDGYLVQKMARNPRHDGVMHALLEWLMEQKPSGWKVRCQGALVLPTSVPEPDLAIVRADADGYRTQHPRAGDVGLVIEVSDTTLAGDRLDKGRLYAEAGIGTYWIINLVDRQIEVYTAPTSGAYGQRQDYPATGNVPFVLEGRPVASLAVGPLLA